MNLPPLNIVVLGLSLSSSWGNGHATTYRCLLRELARRGHRIVFLERDMPWYASNRDLTKPDYCQLHFYQDLNELKKRFSAQVESADLVIQGSYVPEGVEVGRWVQQTAKGLKAFYDIDTPVTLTKLKQEEYDYLHPDLIPGYDLYLSFTGGSILEVLEEHYHSPCARPLYCAVDPEVHFPEPQVLKWDLGYLGTYSDDRQPSLERFMLQAARQWSQGRFIIAGPQYPEAIHLPQNVERTDHLPPNRHRLFYNSQRFTLNITRANMKQAGFSPSVRLFEAAACGTPIISDCWMGLENFFEVGKEILITNSAQDTLRYLNDLEEDERLTIGLNARKKVLEFHTAAHRALELEQFAQEAQQLKTVRHKA